MEVINKIIKLYNNSTPIDEIQCGTVDYFIFREDKNIRFCNTKNNLLNFPVGSDNRIEAFQSFANQNPFFWMIPLKTATGNIFGFVLKSYTQKQYRNVKCKSNFSIFYGWDSFSSFKKNYPIVLTEGVKDCIVLKRIYPYSIACLTSGLHGLKDYEIIKNLTNKVVLAYDNDKAGINATEKNFEKLSNLGLKVQKVFYPSSDIGDLYNNRIGFQMLRNSLEQIFRNF